MQRAVCVFKSDIHIRFTAEEAGEESCLWMVDCQSVRTQPTVWYVTKLAAAAVSSIVVIQTPLLTNRTDLPQHVVFQEYLLWGWGAGVLRNLLRTA